LKVKSESQGGKNARGGGTVPALERHPLIKKRLVFQKTIKLSEKRREGNPQGLRGEDDKNAGNLVLKPRGIKKHLNPTTKSPGVSLKEKRRKLNH